MRPGRFNRCVLTLLILFFTVGAAQGDDAAMAYAIDDQPVLLYKIIQWWYDAPATEAPWFCGRRLSCRTRDPLGIRYAPGGRRLTLDLETDFAELVWTGMSVAGIPPTVFGITWMNPEYFEKVTASVYTGSDGSPQRLCIEGLTQPQADRVAAMAAGLEVILSGPIRGLLDGRIALADTPGLTKVCPESDSTAAVSRAVTLNLRNRRNAEILAIFTTRQPDH